MAGTTSLFWALDGCLRALQKMVECGGPMENPHALAKGKILEVKMTFMDSTVVRAHRHASGAPPKRAIRHRHWAGLVEN